jgi:hypothetical protein
MLNSISSIVPVQQAYQPQPVVSPKPKAAESITQPKADTVTISAQGKQAGQLRTGDYTPAEEAQESSIAKNAEAQAGKK